MHLRYFRVVYSLLDFFSEMGGLFTTFGRLCLLIIAGVNYFGSYQFVMSETFFDRRRFGKQGPFSSGAIKEQNQNDVQWNSFKLMMLNIRTFLPPKLLCCCLKADRAQRLRSKAFRHVLDEVRISNIIQQLRVLKAACQEQRTAEEWEKLERDHMLIAYSDLENNENLGKSFKKLE